MLKVHSDTVGCKSLTLKSICAINICEDAIEDSSSKTKEHDAVFYDSQCNVWLQRLHWAI